MTDLLAEVFRCDFCTVKKERRYFAAIYDGEEFFFTVCLDCDAFMEACEDWVE